MQAAVEQVIAKANKGHALVSAVCYSLRYDKHHHSPALSQRCGHILQLWKSCVLPHYLLYLRYFRTDDQIQRLQVSLNQSLSSTLRVDGHYLALLADTGVPPLLITQRLQLAQLRYRVSQSPHGSLPLFWWTAWKQMAPSLPDDMLPRRMERAVCHIDRDRIDPSAPMPRSVQNAKPTSREKSYKNSLKLQCSKLWRTQLENYIARGPGRVQAFASLFLSDKRQNLYKPAWYLTNPDCTGQLDLLRFRVQAWIDHIPTHRHFGHKERRREYDERYCPYCSSTTMSLQPAGPSTLLGDEEHVLLHCPHSQGILDDWTPKFDRMTRLLDLPVFHSMTQRDKIRVALGEPPPKLLKRQIRVWKTEALPLCGEFIRSLRRHMITIQLLPGDLTSDDEDASSSEEEDPEPLEPPDGYTFAPVPPTQQELEPLNPAGQALVGSHILYKWPRIGWQQGELVKWNDNPKCKNGKKQVNFHAHYSYDNTKPRHVLSLDHYNTEAWADSPNHTWILLVPCPRAPGATDT